MNAIFRRLVLLLCLAALAAGCAAPKKKRAASAPMLEVALLEAGDPRYDRAPATAAVQDRLLAWKGSLSVAVADLTNAVDQAVAVVARHGGYLESRSDHTYGGTTLKLRIPASAFTNAIGALEALGRVESRSVESEDVTEQYVDVAARLKNKLVLRDRLRALLDKATEVKDVLAIETELNRVQGDIDSMEARIQSLQGQVDFAVLDLNLRQKEKPPLLGPLGLVCKGLWWTVRKLFVLRD